MRLKPDQLAQHLQRGLAPVYLIGGDEPLQLMEAGDAVRAAARAAGCSERQVFEVERGFDWGSLLEARDNLSLFAERRLLELRLPSGKPGTDGAAALLEYFAAPPAGDVLLILAGKLDKETQQAKWYAAAERAGAVVQVWPVDAAQLPAWIERRMRGRGMQPAPEAAALLAARVEGNLLACAQEIEKLALLRGAGPVTADDVAEAVADSARYNVYDLVDRALAGEAEQCARVLQGLRGEGEEPVLVLWALARELRGLARMRAALADGRPEERVFAEQRVWDKRKPLLRAALRRHGVAGCHALLRRAAAADRVIKGAAPGDAWDELMALALALAGVRPLTAHT